MAEPRSHIEARDLWKDVKVMWQPSVVEPLPPPEPVAVEPLPEPPSATDA